MANKPIKENLFYYASSELTQDAFLAYVFANYKNLESFVKQLIEDFTGIQVNKIESIIIKKQEKKIDLIVMIEYDSKKVLTIVIEDKKTTNQHDNQLRKYEGIIDNLKLKDPYFIYYKTDIILEDIHEPWKKFDIEKISSIFHQNDYKHNEIINHYAGYVNYINNIIQNPTPELDFSDPNSNYFIIRKLIKDVIEISKIQNRFTATKKPGGILIFSIDKECSKNFYFEYTYGEKIDIKICKCKNMNKMLTHKILKEDFKGPEGFSEKNKNDNYEYYNNKINPYLFKYKNKRIDSYSDLKDTIYKAVKEYLEWYDKVNRPLSKP